MSRDQNPAALVRDHPTRGRWGVGRFAFAVALAVLVAAAITMLVAFARDSGAFQAPATVPLAGGFLVISLAFLLYLHRLLYGRRQGPTPLALLFLGWIPAVSLYLWNPLHLYQLHAKTWGFLSLGVASFVLGYATITWARRGRGAIPPPPRLKDHLTSRQLRAAVRLWWAVFILGSGLFLFYVRSFVVGFAPAQLGNRLFIIRSQLALGQVPAGFYYFYFYELLVPISLVLARLDRSHRRRYIVVGILAFLSLTLTTGRTNATKALLLVLFVFIFEQGHRRVGLRTFSRIAMAGGLVIGMFVILGTLIGKSYSNSPLRDENLLQPTSLPQQARLPYLYYVGSLPSFDQLVTGQAHGLDRGVTFRPAFQIAHVADRHVRVPVKVQGFYAIPYPFNVSTYLAPLLVDYGAVGVILGSFVLGVLCAGTYLWWLQSPSPSTLCLIALVGSLAFNMVGDFGVNDLSWLVQYGILTIAAWYGRAKPHPDHSERQFTPAQRYSTGGPAGAQ